MSGTTESVLVSLGAGLVVLAIGLIIKRIPKPVAVLMAVGIGILAFVLWPRAALVEVPDLSDLSRDEAELRLSAVKLVGIPQPQEAPNTRPEHVIPASQNPLPGTKVRRGTVVRYSISTPTAVAPRQTSDAGGSATGGAISIFSPKEGGEVDLKRGADNVFRFDVEGTIESIDSAKSSLVLWIQPIQPPSDQPGWYLQRLPANGIRSISGNTWRGVCQVGNQQYPPHDGDVIEIAASVVPVEEVKRLEAIQGPLTTVVLPGVVSKVVQLTVRVK
ncbi:MAG TPA: PASTA domain-containing protein [Candidatus Saccharimonadales bacterium]|nr:PASTA domain-containing protein [Candidatus Saccharimonadales bacterium]